MIISLSISNCIRTIHALNAIRLSDNTDAPLPDLLNPDRRLTLEILVRNEFAMLCGSMFPYVTDCSVLSDEDAGPGDDILTMELPQADTLGPGHARALRASIEVVLAQRVLLSILTCADRPAADLRADVDKQLASIIEVVEGTDALKSTSVAPLRL